MSGYAALGAAAGWIGAQVLMRLRLPSPDVGTWIQIAAALVLLLFASVTMLPHRFR